MKQANILPYLVVRNMKDNKPRKVDLDLLTSMIDLKWVSHVGQGEKVTHVE